MSLIKVPLVLTTAVWFHIANTPPNAPAAKVERLKVTPIEAVFATLLCFVKVRLHFSRV